MTSPTTTLARPAAPEQAAAGLRRNRAPLASIAVTLAFFFSLWLLDFPKPMLDDLFYTGAAMNMAKGGDFSNPLLARQGFPSHYFFVYPPLHSYVLFGWLKIFGINSRSMTGFAMLMIAITSVSTIIVLRRYKAGIWLELAVPLGAAFALLEVGLRPDTLGMALTMAGFALADWKPKPGIALACGFLLMFLGGSAAPRVAFFSMALAACAGYQVWRQAAEREEKRRMIAFALSAGLLTGFVFLWLIHFQLGEFLTSFKFHTTRYTLTKVTKGRLLVTFALEHLRILHWPLVLIPLGLLAFLLGKPKENLSMAGIFTILGIPVAVMTGLIGWGATWWLVLAMLFLGGAALKMISIRWRTALTTAIIMVLLVVNRRDFAAVGGILSRQISSDLGEEATAALAIHPSAGHGLLIDCWVARYLYDYRLPEGSVDLVFGAPFPGWLPGCTPLPPGTAEFRAGDVFLAGPLITSHLVQCTYLERDILKWSPFGISRLAIDRYPRHVYLIPAECCRGPRKKPLM
jgi:hypothetical protein